MLIRLIITCDLPFPQNRCVRPGYRTARTRASGFKTSVREELTIESLGDLKPTANRTPMFFMRFRKYLEIVERRWMDLANSFVSVAINILTCV